jgi:uncharacterized membrane-anchored protein YitT (DUF2179 family)
MIAHAGWWRQGRWVEPAFAVGIIVGIAYCAWFLFRNHYLPPPFFYEPSDTYADWFNTAFWARNPGTYDAWRTVYPPLSFLFMRLVGLDYCYPDRRPYDFSPGLDARSCDWIGLGAIWLIFFINILLVWLSFRKMNRSTALPRTICVTMGLPMLDAIERGNLAIISFTCLVLCLGPILKSARLRWVAAGLAVNFKIYLIAAIVPLLLKRRWLWVECSLLSIIVVYLLSYAAFGHGSPIELAENIRTFSDIQATQIMDVWYTSTYQALSTLLKGDGFPMTLVIGSRNVELLAIGIPIVQHLTQALILLAMLATWLRPELIPSYRVACLGIVLALITSEAGGYSQIYFTLFVMMEPWRGFGRRWAICACYVLALPLDIVIDQTPPTVRDTYFGATRTMINYYVTVGPFLRPLIIMTIGMALALVTVRQLSNDIRIQK